MEPKIEQPEIARLVELAGLARRKAYCPYSGFAVGAAVLTSTGERYSGCNVENASYGLACCAERNAIGAAVTGGMQRGELSAVALVAAGNEPVTPCGACLQVIAEFAAPECAIVSATPDGMQQTWRLSDLLPRSFGL